ncbi:acyl-CoA dehydrogenase family protein [Oricola sp.]|uniref:acyl-CoA dehydrogenase family protein n=1 Tax=Oricola sp. TaxID=1979950 RepID=UPI0025FFD671|nr:acyl-CoA dehydrogenase family protein [Oricola sp.]MCI5076072.1 hypothetical protein [Oricola sp.]
MTCNLNRSEDQRQILDAAASMLDADFDVSRDLAADRDRMAKIAEFGAFSLALDEQSGGAGFTLVEEALLHVQFGRHIISTHSIAAPIAARLAAESELIDLVGDAVAGGVLCGGGGRLIDGANARFALVFAPDRLQLIDIAKTTVVANNPGFGHFVPITDVAFDEDAIVATSDSRHLLDIAALLVSAQLLGIAEATRDLAVSYAGVRRQFGKPIGAFQAIKHHCANMAIGAEMLSAQLDMAAIALRDGRDDATFQVAALRLLAPQVALENARLCIQIHGGMGFSAEADAHRFLKQAHVLRLIGDAAPILDLESPMAPYKPRLGG